MLRRVTTRHPLFPFSRLSRLSRLCGVALLCAATAIGCGLPQQPRLRPVGGAAPAKGTDILLLGTDGRGTITEKERRKFHAGGIACNCADVMMLVHVSAKRDRVSVIGLPAKVNAGSLIGFVPIAVQDIPILSAPQNQQCVENSTQAKGDEPLSHILNDIPVLSGNGVGND